MNEKKAEDEKVELSAVDYLNLGNVTADEKDFFSAERYYRKAIELKPDFADAFINLGLLLSKDENCRTEAEELYRKAIKLQSDYAEAYYNLGVLLSKDENRQTEAEELYRKAIELRPDFARSYYNLSCLYSLSRKEANKDGAVKYLEKAIELDSNFKEMAKMDEDFDFIRDDPRFKEIVGD